MTSKPEMIIEKLKEDPECDASPVSMGRSSLVPVYKSKTFQAFLDDPAPLMDLTLNESQMRSDRTEILYDSNNTTRDL